MVSGLDGHSWFGLVVYAVVMGLVIHGVRVQLPRIISRPLIALLERLRIYDPPTLRPKPPAVAPTSAAPSLKAPERILATDGSPRASLRSRSESTLGLPEERAGDEEPAVESLAAVQHEDQRRLTLVADLRTAPVAGVILLLMTRTISGDIVRLGLVGADGVRPYDVLVLFISLAYISTALDSTGALRALSFLITQKAAKTPRRSPPSAEKIASGPKLYSLLYGFWFLAGIVVGNDPIILSGTAFLAYFTQHSGITDSTAWTFSQFISANVASAVLVSSNPTNVLLAGAFKLNFLTDYTAFTILPSVLTALVAFPLTYFTFTLRHPSSRDATEPHARSEYIPAQILPPDVNARSALLDPRGAIFHATLMLTTLAVLVGTSFVPRGKVEVWMVTAAGGIIAFLRDILSERNVKRTSAPTHLRDDMELEVAGATHHTQPPPAVRPRHSLPYLVKLLSNRFPMTSSTISRLPLSLLPFAGGTFILARALTSLGWTSIWAGWLAKIATTPAHAVFFLGFFIPFLMCPLTGTNIGAAILMVQILTDDRFALSPHVLADPRIMKGAIFSTAMASNVGAISWTFSASLAGLLWNSILRQKGIRVNAWAFAGWNLWFLPLLATTASAVVLLEVCYF